MTTAEIVLLAVKASIAGLTGSGTLKSDMKMSRPSIWLKCGSANSFFIASRRTAESTPRATKAE